ncbi:MAG: hypothetical protein WDN45_10910 [Caulobacteraceae bacterium]
MAGTLPSSVLMVVSGAVTSQNAADARMLPVGLDLGADLVGGGLVAGAQARFVGVELLGDGGAGAGQDDDGGGGRPDLTVHDSSPHFLSLRVAKRPPSPWRSLPDASGLLRLFSSQMYSLSRWSGAHSKRARAVQGFA